MLPPIPHSMAPVTAQQDVSKPKPNIVPVTPVTESSKESALSLDKRHPQDAQVLMREEQQRRQKRYAAALLAESEETPELLDEFEHELPRQGLWVDIEV